MVVLDRVHGMDRYMTLEAGGDEVSWSLACLRTAGERLAWLRRRAGMNLTDAASLSGLSRSELSRLENDGRRLKGHHIDILGGLYGVDSAMLKDLVSHSPVPGEPTPRFLPCFEAAELAGTGTGRAAHDAIRLPFPLVVGPDAYLIAVGDAAELPVPGRSMVVIDPAARPVLGDLAANTGTWSPVLLILRRNEAGEFDRGGPARPMQNFHKAVAVFSQSHFASAGADE